MSSYVQTEGQQPNIMTLERRIADLEQDLKDAQQKLSAIYRSWGVEAIITVGNSNNVAFRHKNLRSCKCGCAPQIQEDISAKGTYLVICPECVLRTKSHRRIVQAMRDWQDGIFTPDTVMLQEKLTARDMSEAGAMKLLDGIRTRAVEDYLVKLDAGPVAMDSLEAKEIETAMPETTEQLRRMHAKKIGELKAEGKPAKVMRVLGRPKGRSRVKID